MKEQQYMTYIKSNNQRTEQELVSISEEELAAPGQLDVMMSSSSAAASSSAIVPVRASTQAFEELTRSNLRGTPRVVGHRRTDSAASAASASSADSTESTVATRADAIPPHIQQSTDIDTLVQVAKERRTALNHKDTVEDSQLAMELTTLLLQINKLRSNRNLKPLQMVERV